MGSANTQTKQDELFHTGVPTKQNYTILADDTEEVPDFLTFNAITAATKASPCVLTVTGHPFAVGDRVYIHSVLGMTQLNGRWFYVGAEDTNTISLYKDYKNDVPKIPVDSTGYTTYTSVGVAVKSFPCNGATWHNDTGNGAPAQYAKHGSDAPSANFPPPGSGQKIFVGDLAPLVVYGKITDVVIITYMIAD